MLRSSASRTAIPGIDPVSLANVFESYWRRDPVVGQRQGVGLGLPIVKGLVEGHGGRVWVQSAPGKGARFCFTLPLVRVAPTESKGAAEL